jgi:hypothetical protein
MGASFISVLFASSILGYFLGRDILNQSHMNSLILAFIVGYLSLLLETGLFMIKSIK